MLLDDVNVGVLWEGHLLLVGGGNQLVGVLVSHGGLLGKGSSQVVLGAVHLDTAERCSRGML